MTSPTQEALKAAEAVQLRGDSMMAKHPSAMANVIDQATCLLALLAELDDCIERLEASQPVEGSATATVISQAKAALNSTPTTKEN